MILPKLSFILLATCAFIISTPLQASSAATEHPGAIAILLGLDTVRKELRITPNQGVQLDDIRADFKTASRKLVSATASGAMDRKIADGKLKGLMSKANARALSVLTPSQQCRLTQIEHHLLGGTMLLLPKVQKELGLTNSQILAIEKIHNNGLICTKNINQKFEQGSLSHQEHMATLRSHRIKQANAMLKLLTPTQRKTLRALCGPSFKLV